MEEKLTGQPTMLFELLRGAFMSAICKKKVVDAFAITVPFNPHQDETLISSCTKNRLGVNSEGYSGISVDDFVAISPSGAVSDVFTWRRYRVRGLQKKGNRWQLGCHRGVMQEGSGTFLVLVQ